MAKSSESLRSFDDLYLLQLRDLWDAERQLVEALPAMAKAADNPELKTALKEHLAITREQKKRLDKIFADLGEDPEGHTCAAMKGLIKEGDEIATSEGDPAVRDAGLIAAAQRVEHYEIASYGTARTFAQKLGRKQDASLLQQTLDEEGQADELLTQIAESVVNTDAANA
jgi:ferritin-like metal-binding protein YciE